MSEPLPASHDAGNDTERPKLREILYLDRPRLLSYASQLTDGVSAMRRMLAGTETGSVISGMARELEETKRQENTGKAEGGVPGILNMGGQAVRETTERRTYTTGGDQKTRRELEALLEDKVDLDNLLLLTEQQLRERSILRDFDGTQYGGLLRFHGSLSFADWTIVHDLLKDLSVLSFLDKDASPQPAPAPQATKGGRGRARGGRPQQAEKEIAGVKPQDASAMAKLLKILSLSDITGHMAVPRNHMGVSTMALMALMASLNPAHLTMTLEQLRSAYLGRTIRGTLLGFLPEQAGLVPVNNLATMIDFNEVFKGLVGDVDYAVHPIAIYVELE